MAVRFFLDTNIFVYALDESDPRKMATAAGLAREGLAKETGAISFQVVQEFMGLGLGRFASKLTGAAIEEYVAGVLAPLLRVESSLELYRSALGVAQRFRTHWCDALIVAAARQAGCGILYSEDFQHGQRFDGLRVVNPFV